jgi:hypothetical protein
MSSSFRNMEESGELCTSSLHILLRNLLVGSGVGLVPQHTHSIAGSVTINAKPTSALFSRSSMFLNDELIKVLEDQDESRRSMGNRGTINAKTTVHSSPGSSMFINYFLYILFTRFC